MIEKRSYLQELADRLAASVERDNASRIANEKAVTGYDLGLWESELVQSNIDADTISALYL